MAMPLRTRAVATALLRYVALGCGVLLLLSGRLAAEASIRIEPLPQLANVESWQAPNRTKGFAVDQQADRLHLVFSCRPGNAQTLLLKHPLEIPRWANSLTFLGIKDIPHGTQLKLDFLVRDSAGREYRFYTESIGSGPEGVYRGSCYTTSWTPVGAVRFSVPAFGSRARGGYASSLPGNPAPQPPYTLLGFFLEGQYESADQPTNLLFWGFALARLNPIDSEFYYLFNDQEYFGELDPVPSLTLADFSYSARKLQVSWEVRDDYAGMPVLAGGATYDLAPSKEEPGVNLLQLTEPLPIPIRNPGTYWISVRVRQSNVESILPDKIEEKEYRLFIPGRSKEKMTTWPLSRPIPNQYVRIGSAARDGSYIYGVREPFLVPVAFFRPPGEFLYKIHVRRYPWREEVRSIDVQPAWPGDAPFVYTLDLRTLPAGLYEIEAEIATELRPFDRVTRLVAKRENTSRLTENPDPIPAEVPSFQDELARKTPLLSVTPVFDRTADVDHRWKIFTEAVKTLPPMFPTIEWIVPWALLEPYPGVYDWSELDRILNFAKEKRIGIYLWIGFEAGSLPEWMPSSYAEDEDHRIFGITPLYLFHGGRLNYLAPPLKAHIETLMSRLAARYRGSPALHGYFIMDESYGRTPGGYEPETQAEFRAYCQKRWATLQELNNRWEAKFIDWREVGSPPRDSSDSWKADWWDFYRLRLGSFHKEIVEAIRGQDSRRLIFVEGWYSWELEQWMRDHGCAMANGGAQDPATLGGGMIERAEVEFQERSESVSLMWGDDPTRIEDTVFTATLGGGGNCIGLRTYLPMEPNHPDAWDKPPVSLDRLRKFVPILGELRQTIAMPFDAYLFCENFQNPTPWAMMTLAQSALTFGVGSLPKAFRSKMLFVIQSEQQLRERVIEQLVEYVRKGGTLVMCATAGRKSPDHPGEDWILLRQFGFGPPTSEEVRYYVRARAVPGTVFPSGAGVFELYTCGRGQSTPPGAQTAASFVEDPREPAISWRTFEKGKVVVIWASEIVPPMVSEGHGEGHPSYPFLRDIASWGGVPLFLENMNVHLWANLLKRRSEGVYYCLVGRLMWYDQPERSGEGVIRFPLLPDGRYRVSELVSQAERGVMTADRLKKEGLPVALSPREVTILRLERVD
ncbi:beta-galactosidase [Methylacidimicrobium tartarophylax]|uniref:Beta-galactosidase bgaB n=1 Tax=Methylacidimicrobium tartarophylax TaxID=1041768 RepID=A0A5E6MBC9_9BACT|nr:beta-galactosidase [Methylacidimicrobium tartarophylax]VVM06508.1 Beta-galactosidase bgaB [Methylacidimicrobium tartarophylax]